MGFVGGMFPSDDPFADYDPFTDKNDPVKALFAPKEMHRWTKPVDLSEDDASREEEKWSTPDGPGPASHNNAQTNTEPFAHASCEVPVNVNATDKDEAARSTPAWRIYDIRDELNSLSSAEKGTDGHKRLMRELKNLPVFRKLKRKDF